MLKAIVSALLLASVLGACGPGGYPTPTVRGTEQAPTGTMAPPGGYP